MNTTRMWICLAGAVVGLLAAAGSRADDLVVRETQALIEELDSRQPVAGREFGLRTEALSWEGRRLELPFIRQWREILAAELTRAGATVTEKPGVAPWRVRGNVSADGTWLDLALTIERSGADGEAMTFRRRLPQEPVRRLLIPEPAQLAGYLVQSLERQNRGVAIPVRVTAPEPEAGAVPRNLAGWFQTELGVAMAGAQAMVLVPPASRNPDAHELRVRYRQEGEALRLVATVGKPGEAEWGRSTVVVPLAAFTEDSVRVHFPEPVRVGWIDLTGGDSEADEVPARVREALAAVLQRANVSLAAEDEAAKAPLRLEAGYLRRVPAAPDRGLRRGTVGLTGRLVATASASGPETRAWQSATPVYLRDSGEEAPLPGAAIDAVVADAAQAIFEVIASLRVP